MPFREYVAGVACRVPVRMLQSIQSHLVRYLTVIQLGENQDLNFQRSLLEFLADQIIRLSGDVRNILHVR